MRTVATIQCLLNWSLSRLLRRDLQLATATAKMKATAMVVIHHTLPVGSALAQATRHQITRTQPDEIEWGRVNPNAVDSFGGYA